MKFPHNHGYRTATMMCILILSSFLMGYTSIFAQTGSATSSVVPSNSNIGVGEQIIVTINVDISGVNSPDHKLGSFTGSMSWNPNILNYMGDSGMQGGFTGFVNPSAGQVNFNGANPAGVSGSINILQITFEGKNTGSSSLNLEYSAMASSGTFKNLSVILTVNDGMINVQPPQYTLTMAVNNTGWGTTTPAIGTHTYNESTAVNVTATPAAGYRFVNWIGDVANPSSINTTVTMDANKTVTAHFEPLTSTQYTLTISVHPNGKGTTIPVMGTYTYDEITIVQIRAIPLTDYRFVNWTGDVSHPNNINTTVTVNGNKAVTANFEPVQPIQYTLTMTANPVGGGTTTPAIGTYTYNDGSLVNITALPAAGYRFVNWTGDVSNPNSVNTSVTMNTNKIVTANFQPLSNNQRTLTITVNPVGSGTTTPATGTFIYNQGSVVNISALPAAGYLFVNWTGDVSDPNSINTSVILDANKIVTANFESLPTPQHSLTMRVNPEGHGATTPAIGTYSYDGGSVVSISALPAAGYRFVNWTGDVSNPNSINTTVTLNADKIVTANFEPLPTAQHTLTMRVNPEGGGSTTPIIGTYIHAEGSVVNLSVLPAAGYRFLNWTGDVSDPNSINTTVTLDANKIVTANFEPLPTTQHTLTMWLNPPMTGSTMPAVGYHDYTEGTIVNISAIPAPGYRFVQWSGNVSNSRSASTTVIINSNKTVTAHFETLSTTQHALSIIVSPSGGGTTTPFDGIHHYNKGTIVNLTAISASSYSFLNWTGEVDNPDSACTCVAIDKDKTVTAHFGAIPNNQYTLHISLNPIDGGTTMPSKGTHFFPSGTDVTIKATPSTGYRFVNWTGGENNPNSLSTTVKMNGNKTVKANFISIHIFNIEANPAEAGITNPLPGCYIYDKGTILPVSAMPGDGYRFLRWSANVINPDNPGTNVMVNDNMNVTAYFAWDTTATGIDEFINHSQNRGQGLLLSNHPNPFNLSTTIKYNIPKMTHVTLEIYNIAGKKVTALRNGIEEAGYQSVIWNGRDNEGRLVSGGLYICRLRAGTHRKTIRMLLMK